MEPDSSLSKRLGFAKLLICGKDIDLKAAAYNYPQKTIATGQNEGLLAKSLKDRNTIGILPNNIPSKKLIALTAESGKILFINVNIIINADPKQQQKLIYLCRKTMHYCKHFKVNVCPITLAESEHELLSARQLMVLIKFLGFNGDGKKALGILGSLHGKSN